MLGLELGTLNAYFFTGTFKRHFFDPVFAPPIWEDPKTTANRSWKAFKYALLFFALAVLSMVMLFEYVDSLNEIPEDWYTTLRNVCPTLKKSHTFHYFSLSCTGFLSCVPGFYLWNYLKHRQWALAGRRPKDPSPNFGQRALVFAVVLPLIACADFGSKKVTVLLVGHNDLDPYPDMVKRSLVLLILSWLGTAFHDFLLHKVCGTSNSPGAKKQN